MKIAISGLAGSGKTAVAKKIKEILESRGKSVDLLLPTFKDIVKEMGISLKEYEERAEEDSSIDRAFDEEVQRRFSSLKNVVFASWLAIWKSDADLKVFLHASEKVRAQRIAGREKISFEEALSYVRERDQRNRRRYMKIYGIDIFNPLDVADVCINTENISLEKEAETILCCYDIRTRKG